MVTFCLRCLYAGVVGRRVAVHRRGTMVRRTLPRFFTDNIAASSYRIAWTTIVFSLHKFHYSDKLKSNGSHTELQSLIRYLETVDMPSINVVKRLLKKHHKQLPTILEPSFTAAFEREWRAARRNAIDLGPRPRHNGTPLCLILSENTTLCGVKRENNHLQELDERVYWGDDERKVRKSPRAYRYPTQLDGILNDPFPQDRRTFGDVLAFMHSENINVAGYQKTERERLDCENGRCRCLGPMIRDV